LQEEREHARPKQDSKSERDLTKQSTENGGQAERIYSRKAVHEIDGSEEYQEEYTIQVEAGALG